MIYNSNLTKIVFPENQQFLSQTLLLGNIKTEQKKHVEAFFNKEQQQNIVLVPIIQGYLEEINGKSVARLTKGLNPKTQKYPILTREKILSFNTDSSPPVTLIKGREVVDLSLIHISEPTRPY